MSGEAEREHAGRTSGPAGQTVDQGKGRIFPCAACGADLQFDIGQQSLVCPYCGHAETIEPEGAAVEEQDFRAMLARVVEARKARAGAFETRRTGEAKGGESARDASGDAAREVRCDSCGATVVFRGTLASTECAFCGSPIQRDGVYVSGERVPVDGMLSFRIEEGRARDNLRKWVASRWFTPTEFRRRGAGGKFRGVYLPFWTFDSHTVSRYVGQRGEHYFVTVGSGDNKRRERRTRWYPASGVVRSFFDDVLVSGTAGLPRELLEDLEPWPLQALTPFDPKRIAGFLARTYDVELDTAFGDAKTRIDASIRGLVAADIGGDAQRIHSIHTRYDPISYKQLLLPVWLLAYGYRGKSYRVAINAITGEVRGERPYSWIKITLAVFFGLLAAAAVTLAIVSLTSGARGPV